MMMLNFPQFLQFDEQLTGGRTSKIEVTQTKHFRLYLSQMDMISINKTSNAP